MNPTAYTSDDLRREASEALDRVWFIQSVVEDEQDNTATSFVSFRLIIRESLYVHVFMSQRVSTLYFALILDNRRVFGIDSRAGHWHLHPFENPEAHQPLASDLGPRPLLSFLARVEDILGRGELL